jgi:hypothetical protein
VRVVLKMSIRRSFDGFVVEVGNRVSTSLLLTPESFETAVCWGNHSFLSQQKKTWN